MRKRSFGTYTIAKICGVAPGSVGRWLDEGKIPFFTTGGGYRRVWDNDLAQFLVAHNYPLPASLENVLNPVILVIDDDVLIRRLFKRILAKARPGWVVHEAADGFEAGEMLAPLKPSLVILDQNMPGVNGLEICGRIRRNPQLKDIKILMITGDPSTDIRELAFKGGVDAYMIKPFIDDGFLKVIDQLLAHRPASETIGAHEK